ncbi:MAG: hypothetical protein C5B55_11255 [Blastocatellia bacterium]|nr:MAG: hypothetical protein C5B55_11255 [Blastocatellia bacterium]
MPNREFRGQLELGLGHAAFMNKRWDEAEKRFSEVIEGYSDTKSAPEALYWKGVSHYKKTNDHTVLGETAEQFKQRYSDSIWALKTIPWAH